MEEKLNLYYFKENFKKGEELYFEIENEEYNLYGIFEKIELYENTQATIKLSNSLKIPNKYNINSPYLTQVHEYVNDKKRNKSSEINILNPNQKIKLYKVGWKELYYKVISQYGLKVAFRKKEELYFEFKGEQYNLYANFNDIFMNKDKEIILKLENSLKIPSSNHISSLFLSRTKNYLISNQKKSNSNFSLKEEINLMKDNRKFKMFKLGWSEMNLKQYVTYTPEIILKENLDEEE
ncbi:MAG: hypothetical protein HRU03_05245 [Nanoarchaeales archaeon]|nr:hypothetical protein [Nanoarchaeales archaeon]